MSKGICSAKKHPLKVRPSSPPLKLANFPKASRASEHPGAKLQPPGGVAGCLQSRMASPEAIPSRNAATTGTFLA